MNTDSATDPVRLEPEPETTKPVAVWPHMCDAHPQTPALAGCAQCGRYVCRQCRVIDKQSGLGLCVGCKTSGMGGASTGDVSQQAGRHINGKRSTDTSNHKNSPFRALLIDDDAPPPTGESEPHTVSEYPSAVKNILVNPILFFRQMALEGNLSHVVALGVLCSVLGTFVSFLWAPLMPEAQSELLLLQEQLALPLPAIYIGVLLALPFAAIIEIFIYALAVHLSLTVIGNGSKGFVAAFKVASYAMVSKLALVIPMAGGILALAFFVSLLVLGTRYVHRLPLNRTILAVLVPVLILMFFGVVAVG